MPMATLPGSTRRALPAFTGLTPPPAGEQIREDWAESFDLPDDMLFVAELDGRPAGSCCSTRTSPASASARAASAWRRATLPELRGRGVGTALVEHALGWAAEDGFQAVTTDWRVPNLLSSRFWPARGFRPTFHRLHRVLRSGG